MKEKRRTRRAAIKKRQMSWPLKRHLPLLKVKLELTQYGLDQSYVSPAKKAVIAVELAALQAEIDNLEARRPAKRLEVIDLGFRTSGNSDSAGADADVA
jgi:hypothetical protein